MTKRKRYDKIAFVFIAPFLIFTLIFIYMPILFNLVLSFTKYNLTSIEFVGLLNYSFIFKDRILLMSLRNTVIFCILSLLVTMIFGLIMAEFLNKKVLLRNFCRTSFFLPYVISMVSASMVWLWIYEPSHGFLNTILKQVGITPQKWLFDQNLAIYSLVFMNIWQSVGYNMIIYLAGLQGIPKYLYESAIIDGATKLEMFKYITLPLLSPVTFFLFVTGFIKNFNVFEQVLIMTGGGPVNSTTTVVHQIYDRAFEQMQFGYAGAVSMVLLVLVAAITLINIKYGNKKVDMNAE